MKPIAMNQDKFYMPKTILRPEGFNVEKFNKNPKAVEVKKAAVKVNAKSSKSNKEA
jgi:hypothetical protein